MTPTPTAPSPTEEELHEFVDDALPATRREEIARILSADSALAARVAAYIADRDALRAALHHIDDAPIPATWSARIEAAMAPSPRLVTPRRFAIAASLAVLLSAAAALRWGFPHGDTILAAAEAARDRSTQAAGAPLPPAAARDALLRSALGLPVRAPDLHRFGFTLARLEIFGHPGAGAAQLHYRDAQQRALTIYVRASDGTVKFDLLKHGKTRVCIWQDDVIGAVIMADMSAGEMMRVASGAYTDLNL